MLAPRASCPPWGQRCRCRQVVGSWLSPPGVHLPRQGRCVGVPVTRSDARNLLRFFCAKVSCGHEATARGVSCTLKTAPHHLRSASPSPPGALPAPGAGLEPSSPCPSALGRVALSSHPRPLAPPRGRAAPPAPRGEARRCGRAEHSRAAQSTAAQSTAAAAPWPAWPAKSCPCRGTWLPSPQRGSRAARPGRTVLYWGARRGAAVRRPGSGPGVRRLPTGSAFAWKARR